MEFYDDWKLKCGHEKEVIICHCAECGGEIFEGEDIYDIRAAAEKVHNECFPEYARGALDAISDIATKEE